MFLLWIPPGQIGNSMANKPKKAAMKTLHLEEAICSFSPHPIKRSTVCLGSGCLFPIEARSASGIKAPTLVLFSEGRRLPYCILCWCLTLLLLLVVVQERPELILSSGVANEPSFGSYDSPPPHQSLVCLCLLFHLFLKSRDF